jgi:putative transposase
MMGSGRQSISICFTTLEASASQALDSQRDRVALRPHGNDLAHPFGRIPCASLKIQRDKAFTLLTNDMERSALALAELYRGRWRIELLFRWIKQQLKIRKFLGNNDNAIRLQLFAAMIAYALLRIAAQALRINIPILRFTNLVIQCVFERRCLAAIERPPPVNPSARRDRTSPDQMSFTYV